MTGHAGRFLLTLDPGGIVLDMRLRLVAILLLVPVVIGLVPLAYAAVTDPTWVPGFWDGDDDDDVILTAASGVGTLGPGTPRPDPLPVVGDVPCSPATAATTARVYQALVRAPPAS